jgi:hypothetical protein
LLQGAKNLIASSFTLVVVPAFVASFPEIELGHAKAIFWRDSTRRIAQRNAVVIFAPRPEEGCCKDAHVQAHIPGRSRQPDGTAAARLHSIAACLYRHWPAWSPPRRAARIRDPGFPPAGIAVTATFVAGATALPGTFLGSFLLNLWIGYLIAGRVSLTQIVTALVIAAGSMTQAAIGGAALRRTIGYPAPFNKPSDILLFFLLVPILCLTSATISLGGLWALGIVELPELPMNWVMWWLGDTLGVLAALPLMIWLADEP